MSTEDMRRFYGHRVRSGDFIEDPKRRKKDQMLRYRFRMTIEEWEALLESQGGHCALCLSVYTLSVDHDHSCCSTDMTCGNCVRGILCRKCNTALGLLGEDRDRILGALQYLSQWD